MENAELSYRLSLHFATQLVESGVELVVASPGFRNSPLVLACRKTKEIEVISCLDERGAAYFALSCAKISRKPVAVLCTSGTAVANYMPAAMEAAYSNLPLVIITADRPAELVGTGANQCADQIHFFASIVRHSISIEPAFDGKTDWAYARFAVGKALSIALAPNPGPVHINIRFREPFLPSLDQALLLEAEERPKQFWKFLPAASGPSAEQVGAIKSVYSAAKRPLILLGPCGFTEDRLRAIINFAGFSVPILAETSSGATFGGTESVVSSRVDFILSEMLSEKMDGPDLIIRFGAPLTSKLVSKILKKFQPAQIIFDEHTEAREPDLYPSIFIQGGMDGWLKQAKFWKSQADKYWRECILESQAKIELDLERHISQFPLTEWFFHRKLESFLGNSSVVFLGNSMPIRDFHSVFPPSKKNVSVYTNRGQSGIDGLIASSAGVAFSTKKETHAILGDLSTLHDLPSFSLLNSLREKISLTLWIMNNNGGEIFRTVPTAKMGGKQEWFTTPQEFDLSAIAKSFKIPFTRITKKEDLLFETNAFGGSGPRIVEILLESKSNLDIRQTFQCR